ncbi:MAG: HAMP domain-containing sensor histidine kinase [Candidatus Tantalella remota]|nr:HAMP domain-containing sensor histidine kinase [Candidatus Tantalella remota]
MSKLEGDYIEFIKEVLEMDSLIAKRRGISVDLRVEGVIPRVYFDRKRMQQVINNLVENAIKYSYNDFAVCVEIKRTDEMVMTGVVDQGLGIPSRERRKLFREFQTTRIKPMGNEEQIGLGLSIAQKIVRLHGGEIGFRSELNKGSTFYFTLPV